MKEGMGPVGMAIPRGLIHDGKNKVIHRDGFINYQGVKGQWKAQWWKILGPPQVAIQVPIEGLPAKTQVLERPSLQFTQWILNLYGLVHSHWVCRAVGKSGADGRIGHKLVHYLMKEHMGVVGMAIPCVLIHDGENQVVHRDGLINDQGAKKKLESQGWKILGEPKVVTHVTVEVLPVKAQVLEGTGLQFTQWILNLYGMVHSHWFSLSGLEMGKVP